MTDKTITKRGQSLAQPAEAEGVDVVAEAYRHRSRDSMQVAVVNIRQIGSLRDGDKLVRQSDHLAALSAVTAERDAMSARLAEWERSTLVRQNMELLVERDQLKAEVKRLRKDAERYRWVKGCDPDEIDIVIENPGDDLDSAIDAAMAEKEGE